jgi:hypothetical protein
LTGRNPKHNEKRGFKKMYSSPLKPLRTPKPPVKCGKPGIRSDPRSKSELKIQETGKTFSHPVAGKNKPAPPEINIKSILC